MAYALARPGTPGRLSRHRRSSQLSSGPSLSQGVERCLALPRSSRRFTRCVGGGGPRHCVDGGSGLRNAARILVAECVFGLIIATAFPFSLTPGLLVVMRHPGHGSTSQVCGRRLRQRQCWWLPASRTATTAPPLWPVPRSGETCQMMTCIYDLLCSAVLFYFCSALLCSCLALASSVLLLRSIVFRCLVRVLLCAVLFQSVLFCSVLF